MNSQEFYMIPLELFIKISRHYFQTREVNVIEEEEDYEFVDFEEMFTEKHVAPFGGKIKEKKISISDSSDYYKKYFVSFNPEDNDGLIGGDTIPGN